MKQLIVAGSFVNSLGMALYAEVRVHCDAQVMSEVIDAWARMSPHTREMWEFAAREFAYMVESAAYENREVACSVEPVIVKRPEPSISFWTIAGGCYAGGDTLPARVRESS